MPARPPIPTRLISDEQARLAFEARRTRVATTAELVAVLGVSQSALTQRWRALGLGKDLLRKRAAVEHLVVPAFARCVAGERAPDLAAELSVVESALYGWWRELGLTLPGSHPVKALTNLEIAQAAAAVRGGEPLRRVAKRTGRSAHCLGRHLLARHGLRSKAKHNRPKTSRDLRVLTMLLDGEGWEAIVAKVGEEGTATVVRNRLQQGVLRYCARNGIPVPKLASRNSGASELALASK